MRVLRSLTMYYFRKDSLLDLPSDVQYIRWSPEGSSLVWVRGNDLYYAKTPNGASQQLTFDGTQNVIYNGVPDWVYEGLHLISWVLNDDV